MITSCHAPRFSPNPRLRPPPASAISRARALIWRRELITFNGTSDCTLIDLSRSGARLAAQDCPRVGAMVVVDGLPIELFGAVRWSSNGLFGFHFDTPLPLSEVIAMRHYADDTGARQERIQRAYAQDWVGVF